MAAWNRLALPLTTRSTTCHGETISTLLRTRHSAFVSRFTEVEKSQLESGSSEGAVHLKFHLPQSVAKGTLADPTNATDLSKWPESWHEDNIAVGVVSSAVEEIGVAEIIFDQPNRRNAMSAAMISQMLSAIDTIDAALRKPNCPLVALLIRGSGGECFSAGLDLSFARKAVNTPEAGYEMSGFMNDAFSWLRQCGLVSVCGLNGPAVGGGTELMTVGDFRIVADWQLDGSLPEGVRGPSKFFAQFVHPRLGAAPGWGGAGRLATVVSRKQALKWSLSGRVVSLEEAVDAGLVDAVQPLAWSKSQDPIVRRNEESAEWVSATRSFLWPMLEGGYAGSARAIKSSIAATEWLTPQDASAVEVDMFASRWFAPDHQYVMENSSRGRK